jgi:uncharacterized protein (DUF849 family)
MQGCTGGVPNDLQTLMAMVSNIPGHWNISAFSLGQFEMSYVAVSILAGGNVRVGLEDNLWVEKGKIATNAQLVEIATTIILYLGARIIGPVEVREKLKLVKKASM